VNSGFAPEFALNISIQDHFLDAKLAIRVRKMFCHHAGQALFKNKLWKKAPLEKPC